tara:strand:- start:414 stop:680 length:267 start_codon:yes stop_codon:yes gene_type:complete
MKDTIRKVEHIWCESDDRWVYLERNGQNKVIGLNFMQGDEYDYFKTKWCESDESLTKFYKEYLSKANTFSTLGLINKIMGEYTKRKKK